MRLQRIGDYTHRAFHLCRRLARLFFASRQMQSDLVRSNMDVDIAAQLEVFIKQIFEDEIRPQLSPSHNEEQLILAYKTMSVEFNNIVTRLKGIEARMAVVEKTLVNLEKMPATLMEKLAGAIASAK